jgi:hypothetical protein
MCKLQGAKPRYRRESSLRVEETNADQEAKASH